MEVTVPLHEEALIYAGQIACLLASAYTIKQRQVAIGLLLLIAFTLQIASGYILVYSESDLGSQGACWATGATYYDCLPMLQRIAAHAGQIGGILLGVALFLSARKLGNQGTRNPH